MKIVLVITLLSTFLSVAFADFRKFRKSRFLQHHARGKIQKRSNPVQPAVKPVNQFDELSWKIDYYRKLQKQVGRHDKHLLNHYFQKYIENGFAKKIRS